MKVSMFAKILSKEMERNEIGMGRKEMEWFKIWIKKFINIFLRRLGNGIWTKSSVLKCLLDGKENK